MRNSNESASGRTTVTARRDRCAFTLVEIICVVVILAIAALIAIPAFSGASQMQVKSAADKLAADIEYAKSMAVTTQKNYEVIFDTTAEQYQIKYFDTATSTWKDVADPVKKTGSFSVTYPQESRLSSVGIKTASFNGSLTLQFDSAGIPYGGGNPPATALTATGTVILEAKGTTTTFTVSVEPVTGYVSIQ